MEQRSVVNRLSVQDPALSSPGLAFFMQTVAEYGDQAANITGLRTGLSLFCPCLA